MYALLALQQNILFFKVTYVSLIATKSLADFYTARNPTLIAVINHAFDKLRPFVILTLGRVG
jgi:hypothetical protein